MTKPHHFILFRYAETLLNYAEAMNELGGPDYKITGRPTAREALNQVRAAANMPLIEDTGEAFTKRLRNERRIELAFEEMNVESNFHLKIIVFGIFAVGWTGTR